MVCVCAFETMWNLKDLSSKIQESIRRMSSIVDSGTGDSHQKRVLLLRERLKVFNGESQILHEFLQKPMEMPAIDSVEQCKDYEVKRCEEYTPIGHLNTMYCHFYRVTMTSDNKQRLYARLFLLNEPQYEHFSNHFSQCALKIWKYLSEKAEISVHIVRLVEVFQCGVHLFATQRRFDQSCSLAHKLWNYSQLPTHSIKDWIVQLASAVDAMNLCGVAHRFIRLENILITIENRIKLTGFDYACVFWDGQQPILQRRGLSIEHDPALLDHLPPECFAPEYDASDVDVWSIGVIMCLLLARNNPIDINEPNMIGQWKFSWERRILADEIRFLLDDVFKLADKRITAMDLKNDHRLLQKKASKPVNVSEYYRIDIQKNINVECNEDRKVDVPPVYYQHAGFSEKVKDIYRLQCFKPVDNEDTMLECGHTILRNKSFTKEFDIFLNDHYMRSVHRINNVCTMGLAKIIVLNQIPLRNRNMLLNESVKIMRFFSTHDYQIQRYFHKVIETFLLDNRLIIFYENILDCRSIYQLCKEYQVTTPLRIQKWHKQLGEVVDFLSYYAISHRYIRPEYVFINSRDHIKLTHFEMACFMCNPIQNTQVARHRGLQDERQFLWDHLPPECFLSKYDSLVVDIWSLGVSILFCLTGENPFTIPFEVDEAERMWATFKNRSKPKLKYFEELLNAIFVEGQTRIKSFEFLELISTIEFSSTSLTSSGYNSKAELQTSESISRFFTATKSVLTSRDKFPGKVSRFQSKYSSLHQSTKQVQNNPDQ